MNIKEAKEKLKEALEKCPHIVGIGIALDNKKEVICINVNDDYVKQLSFIIPKNWQGYPVVLKVVCNIKARRA